MSIDAVNEPIPSVKDLASSGKSVPLNSNMRDHPISNRNLPSYIMPSTIYGLPLDIVKAY
jgi:hypothetical protein